MSDAEIVPTDQEGWAGGPKPPVTDPTGQFPVGRYRDAGASEDELQDLVDSFLAMPAAAQAGELQRIAGVATGMLRDELEARRAAQAGAGEVSDTAGPDADVPEGSETVDETPEAGPDLQVVADAPETAEGPEEPGQG